MAEPQEPPCPPGRKSHRERVKDIDALLLEGKVGAICIDDTEEHKAWYLHELAKYPRLTIVDEGPFPESAGVYIIKVRKEPSLN